MKKYYSIRVVEAKNFSEAISKVECEDFVEDDEMCDRLMTAEAAEASFKIINEREQ